MRVAGHPGWLAPLLALAVAACACGGRAAPTGAGTARDVATPSRSAPAGDIRVLSQFDLPYEDERSRELSGIAWDDSARTLYAISDNITQIVPLRASEDLSSWTLGEPLPVTIPTNWDGEGLALLPDGFLMSNESGARLFELDRHGKTRRSLEVPTHFSASRKNRSFEALALSPDGRYLFTANESALETDGPQPDETQGTVVRILRIDRQPATSPPMEFAYRTEPVFAPPAQPGDDGSDMGVAEILALSANDLLVLERSFVPRVGNSIRIHRVSLEGAPDVKGIEHLGPSTPALAKTLLLDFDALPELMIARPGESMQRALYPNYEGMTLGPALPDGRRALILISDDNARPIQRARILVLSVPLVLLAPKK